MNEAALPGMVAGATADAGGHLVLADWLEEHLGRADLAAVLRQTRDDPRAAGDAAQTSFHGFRFRLLTLEVMLYMTRYEVYRRTRPGRAAERPGGHILGLTTAPGCAAGSHRLTRWLPDDGSGDEVKALWADLGQSIPPEATR